MCRLTHSVSSRIGRVGGDEGEMYRLAHPRGGDGRMSSGRMVPGGPVDDHTGRLMPPAPCQGLREFGSGPFTCSG